MFWIRWAIYSIASLIYPFATWVMYDNFKLTIAVLGLGILIAFIIAGIFNGGSDDNRKEQNDGTSQYPD